MFSVRNHHRRNHQSQSRLNQSHQNQGVNSWIILQLQKKTYWLQAENWSKKADGLLWAYVLLRPDVLFRLGQSTITMNPRPICLGIQLRVFGVKSFSTLKMSRSLKMLLPVSHRFIKDWNMEMSNSRASFLCIRLDLWRMKKRVERRKCCRHGDTFWMNCVIYKEWFQDSFRCIWSAIHRKTVCRYIIFFNISINDSLGLWSVCDIDADQ